MSSARSQPSGGSALLLPSTYIIMLKNKAKISIKELYTLVGFKWSEQLTDLDVNEEQKYVKVGFSHTKSIETMVKSFKKLGGDLLIYKKSSQMTDDEFFVGMQLDKKYCLQEDTDSEEDESPSKKRSKK